MNQAYFLKPFKKESPNSREILFNYERHEDILILSYTLNDSNGVIWPKKQHSERAFELWKTTCFEFFTKDEHSEKYYEFNFSPSSQWDAYLFESYRSPSPPKRAKDCQVDFLKIENPSLQVKIKLPISATLLANASAVIEDQNGITYYAVTHSKDKPDFHDQKTLTLKL